MAVPKILLIGSLVVFAGIGIMAISKKKGEKATSSLVKEKSISTDVAIEKKSVPSVSDPDFPNIDRVHQLFTTGPSKLPIVETLEYSSSVSWLKGRPAWLADYAVNYNTSKHFIARSLNGRPDYFSQKVVPGSRFNVFKKDKRIEFHLLVDLSKLKLAFYYVDLDSAERVLLKVYPVGIGRLESTTASGTLTPLGTYQLGDKVSTYKPGTMGLFHGQKAEMIRIFGSRWIPFGMEIEGCTEPAKGYGLHGAPWVVDAKSGSLVENRSCIGKYDSDGCIRLYQEDMEELYAIVVSKPTFVHIAKKFQDIKLPGVEVGTPSREK